MDNSRDPWNLQRFLDAQEGHSPVVPWGETYERALMEIRMGRKLTHWIWYVFPQLKFLAKSEIADFYGIQNLEEARAYLNHPILRRRLLEISGALLQLEGKTALEILGATDRKKLRASMTLFQYAEPENPVFPEVLERYYGGDRASWTVAAMESGIYQRPE